MPNSNDIKHFFSFNRAERFGLIVLFFILLLLILANIYLPRIFLEKRAEGLDAFKNEIAQFEEARQNILDSLEQASTYKSSREAYVNHLTPFPFDPNNLSEGKWRKIGLNDKQISIIKNYEAKGGRFYNPRDLKKIYGISNAEFNVLEPFIVIENKADFHPVKEIVLHPFEFNPNTIDKDGLIRLGLGDKLSNTIINYREKGGHFYNTDDLGKIYGMDSAIFVQLTPFVIIPIDTSYLLKTQIAAELMIDVNHADTLDLQQLRGIGPSFARRIVKYGELLGGYHDKEQLLEVFGMDSLRFAQISDHVAMSTKSLKKININTAGIKELIKHPYIEFYLAKSIITQREEIGKYNNLEELLDARLVYDELFQKLIPYLTL